MVLIITYRKNTTIIFFRFHRRSNVCLNPIARSKRCGLRTKRVDVYFVSTWCLLNHYHICYRFSFYFSQLLRFVFLHPYANNFYQSIRNTQLYSYFLYYFISKDTVQNLCQFSCLGSWPFRAFSKLLRLYVFACDNVTMYARIMQNYFKYLLLV